MKFVVAAMRQVRVGLVMLIALTVILGVAYPAAVWAISRVGDRSAEGSPITDRAGCVVGSALLGVDPQVPAGTPDPYFHARVVGSVGDDDPMAPGDPAAGAPSNLGPSSPELAQFVDRRRALIAAREHVAPAQVPVDAVTGSGSGLDPQISPAYAALQVPRVARVNHLSVEAVRQLVAEHTEGRQWGFLGAPRVDVPALNVALGLTAPHCETR